MKYKILGLTLARGASKGIRKKNIKKLLGKPLIAYTIEEALKSKYLSEYIVSTDDNEIAKISKKYGAKVPFLRPSKLAQDNSSSVSAMQHAVNFMEKQNKCKYDFVIELMCTNPLKTVFDIDKCINKLIKTKADSVIAVHQLEDHHPARIKKIVNDKIINFSIKEKPESRRQDLRPKAYIRSGSIYALKRNYLMKKSKRYGSKNSRPYILRSEKTVNIDSLSDFILAEHIMKNAK